MQQARHHTSPVIMVIVVVMLIVVIVVVMTIVVVVVRAVDAVHSIQNARINALPHIDKYQGRALAN
jgi:hypothetical protein